jgi:hypothetical protein
MNSVKALLIIQIQMACMHLFQNIYHHEQIVARAYRVLADRHLNDPRRSVILMLADVADRRAQHYALRLSRLRSTYSLKKENWVDWLWCWLLGHGSINFAIQWIEWVEERDSIELAHLSRRYHLLSGGLVFLNDHSTSEIGFKTC